MRTKIFVTIDTEFSIDGAFVDPARNSPISPQNVRCMVGDRSEGLGFLLEIFEQTGLEATFFVETLQYAFFGHEPMGELARLIHESGHDAQLHLHPVWTYFDRPGSKDRLATEKPRDSLHGRLTSEVLSGLRRGQESFQRWGLPAPIALRTGNLMVNFAVSRAMAQAGPKVASNVGRAVFEPEEQALRLDAGVHLVEGVIEIPALSCSDIGFGTGIRRKCLTITGSSLGEARYPLERAHAEGVEAIVILTGSVFAHLHSQVAERLRRLVGASRLADNRPGTP